MSDQNDSSPTTASPYRSAAGTPKRECSASPECAATDRINRGPREWPLMLTAGEAPFDPPRRRSSLAFSQLFAGTKPKSAAGEAAYTPNVGRKRTHATPFLRPAAAPGHASRIQPIFQDATAMVQVDVEDAG